MGIKDLYKALEKFAPGSVIILELSYFDGYRIAIDISVFLYRYILSAGPKLWINTFIIFLCILKEFNMKPIFVFDGPDCPIEKREEQLRRREETAKIIEKIKEAKRLLLKLTGKPAEYLTESLASKIKKLMNRKRNEDPTNYTNIKSVISSLQTFITKKEGQTIPITQEFAQKAKQLIEALGWRCLQATGEAETLCCYLAIKGYVDSVLTEDTDVTAYGTPLSLTKIDLTNKTVTVLKHDVICDKLGFDLELNKHQFRDFCILLSCDYNHRIKVLSTAKKPKATARYKCVGMVAAYGLIKQYKKIENIESICEDISVCKYKRCRELFTVPKNLDWLNSVKILNKPIDEEKLEAFLDKNRVNIKLDYILEKFKPVEIMYKLDDLNFDTESDEE